MNCVERRAAKKKPRIAQRFGADFLLGTAKSYKPAIESLVWNSKRMQKHQLGLLAAGVAAVAVGLGLYWNATRRDAPQPAAPAPVAAAEAPAAPPAKPAETPAKVEAPAEAVKPQQTAEAAPAAPVQAQAPAPAQDNSAVPVFDVLRVEPDGSVVIAGKAAPNADVDVVSGSKVLGKTRAADNGDFAVVLDQPLKPGDHQLVLRATGADSKAATSAQTAVVSVPETASGQVLALVQEPGQASRLITRPDAAPEKPAESPAEKPAAVRDAPIAIEAVEIDGQSVFVAGAAKGGVQVAVHANAISLGSAPVSPEGRFLVQSRQPLPEGDYIVRADLLDAAGRIVATARAPFRREAGENVSAVAPAAGKDVASGPDAAAAPLKKVEGSVIIRRGDNLWTISRRTYGKGTRYTTIYLANRDQIRNPDLIWPGQVFSMPKDALTPEEATRRLSDKPQATDTGN